MTRAFLATAVAFVILFLAIWLIRRARDLLD